MPVLTNPPRLRWLARVVGLSLVLLFAWEHGRAEAQPVPTATTTSAYDDAGAMELRLDSEMSRHSRRRRAAISLLSVATVGLVGGTTMTVHAFRSCRDPESADCYGFAPFVGAIGFLTAIAGGVLAVPSIFLLADANRGLDDVHRWRAEVDGSRRGLTLRLTHRF